MAGDSDLARSPHSRASHGSPELPPAQNALPAPARGKGRSRLRPGRAPPSLGHHGRRGGPVAAAAAPLQLRPHPAFGDSLHAVRVFAPGEIVLLEAPLLVLRAEDVVLGGGARLPPLLEWLLHYALLGTLDAPAGLAAVRAAASAPERTVSFECAVEFCARFVAYWAADTATRAAVLGGLQCAPAAEGTAVAESCALVARFVVCHLQPAAAAAGVAPGPAVGEDEARRVLLA
jgi:hypothetical protein